MAIDNTTYYTDAFYYLWTFNMGMGDSISELAELECDAAGIDYWRYADPDDGEPKDDDEILMMALEEMVSKKSKHISDTLWYLFTEETCIDDIFYYLELPEPHSKSVREREREEMLQSLDAIHEVIGTFPGGGRVKKALEDNVLSKIDLKG